MDQDVLHRHEFEEMLLHLHVGPARPLPQLAVVKRRSHRATAFTCQSFISTDMPYPWVTTSSRATRNLIHIEHTVFLTVIDALEDFADRVPAVPIRKSNNHGPRCQAGKP
jgi:hypothetical protein